MSALNENAKAIFKFILERYSEKMILPTEKELCQEFGTTRNSIREVTAVMKLIGAITTTQGGGHRLTNKKEMEEFYNRYLKN